MKLKLNLTAGLLLAVGLTHFLTTSSLWATGACTAARFNDWKSSGCHQVPGGNQTVCPTCPVTGMPRWWIDEPYINLYLADTPLSYATSAGQEMAFTFNYKQRYVLPPIDQCPNAYTLAEGAIYWRSGMNDAYMTLMRSAGYTNAAWAHNWMMDITFWDAPWEAGFFHPPYTAPSVSTSTSVFTDGYEAFVRSPSGGIDYFYNSVSGSSLNNPNSQVGLSPQSGLTYLGLNYPTVSTNFGLTNGIYWGNATNGFKMVYADGSRDIFGLAFYVTPNNSFESTAHAFLTQRIDPQGRVTQVGYEKTPIYYYPNGTPYIVFRVKYVVDPDLRTNTFQYNATGGIRTNAWQVTEIDDPFGRKAAFTYESGTAWLSSITDGASNSSSFSYQTFQSTNFWLNSLTTPYGTTGFTFDQVSDPSSTNANNFTQRATYVSEPTGAGQLFYYLHQATNGVPATTPSPTSIPGGTDFDDGTAGGGIHKALTYRDSFHWGRRQFQALSSGVTTYLGSGNLTSALSALSTNDFLKAHLSHWLLAPSSGPDVTDDGISVTELISAERDPSPDAPGLISGLWTWYDYANKTSPELAGDAEVTCVAQFLPDGTSHYTRYNYYYYGAAPFPGLVADSESGITLTNGTLGELTNWFKYSASGIDLTNVSNSVGQSVNYVFNANHQVTSLTNAVHETTTFTWNSTTHNLASVSLPNGEVITPTYFPANTALHPLSNNTAFIKQIEAEPQGRFINITDYTNSLPRLVQVSGTGLATLLVTNFWDGLNRLTGTAFPDNSAVSNVYSALSLTSQKDRLANWTYFHYDGLEHLTSITNARMAVTTLSWCGCGSLTSIVDPLTKTTSFNYDNQSRLTNISFPNTSSVTYQYDLNGRVTNVFDGSSRSLRLAYNNQSLVTNLSNTYGPLRQTVYDLLSRPIKITDANNITITNGYDALNRLVSRVWTLDGVGEGFAYATNGLIAYTNRNQQVTRFARDQASRLTAITDADLQVTQFGYDAANHLTSLIDGLNRTNTWNYNQYGWMTNKVDATNREVFRYTYDADGRLTNRWMIPTNNTGYAYDAVGNLTNIVYSNAPTFAIGYAYDAANRLTSMLDAVGTSLFGYTEIGQLASETGPWTSNTITYGYTQGHRTSLSLLQPTGGAWSQTYGYDANQWRLTGLSSPAGSFTYGYPASASALIQSLGLPNTAGIAYQYDTLARLTNTSLANAWGQVLDGYGYGYDPLGQRKNISRYLGLATNNVVAGYDNIGQLTNWSGAETGGALRLNEQLGYGYDAAGNLNLRTNNALVQTFAPDTLNQLATVTRAGTLTESGATPAPASSVTVNGSAAQTYGDFTFARTNLTLVDGANTFTNVARNAYGAAVTNILTVNLPATNSFQYDSNGNLTNDGVRAFIYDAENQLTNVNVAGQWKTEYVYDGFRRKRLTRDYSWQSGAWLRTNETRYVYDRMQVIQERNSNNVVQVTYTRGLDLSLSLQRAGGIGGLLARTDASGSTFYHSDGSGNITALMDTNQNIVARYEYDPFGKLIGKWGPLADANTYRFSSKEFQRNSGLYYYGYRFYEPNLQRWLNRDPMGEDGGINLYQFVYNNPNSWIDPDGDSPEGGIIGGVVGGVIGGVVGGGIGTIGFIIPPLGPVTVTIGAGEGAAIGAGIGALLGSFLPNAGPMMCPMKGGKGERNWSGNDPEPWKGYRPKDPNDPSKGGWKKDPNGKMKPVPRPEGPPPPKHPNW